MADLRELTTDAKRLYEALDYLLEKQDEAKADEIDFKEIWFCAKARPFEHHCIERLELDEARNYLLLLSGLIALADDSEKKKVQIRFLARIIAGYKRTEISLRDIVNDGLFLQEENIDKLQEITNDDIKIYLLIDLLLMIYLDENLNERQMNYAVGTVAFLGLNKAKITAIGTAVKGILEQKDDMILAQAKDIDVNGLCCYMKNPPDGVVVNDLDKAKNINAKKIIFGGMEWRGLATIDIDEFCAETIEFRSCVFKSVQGMQCRNKHLILKDCAFLECEVEENMFILKNAEIINCLFKDIKSYDSKHMYLIYILNSMVIKSKFENVDIQHNNECPYGGVLESANCVFEDVTFKKIVTQSGYASSERIVFDIMAGRLIDCTFTECSLADKSYLLTITRNTYRRNLSVEKLESNRWQENTGYVYNTEDLSIIDVFGGGEMEWDEILGL